MDAAAAKLPALPAVMGPLRRWAAALGDGPHRLYSHFWRRVLALRKTSPKLRGKRVVVWEDALFEAPHLAAEYAKEDVVVQTFKRPKYERTSLYNVTALGLRAIFTDVDTLYLDNEAPFSRIYRYEPFEQNLRRPWAKHQKLRLSPRQQLLVLGGEVACWGRCMEGGGRNLLGGKRLAGVIAAAERLWSTEELRDVANAVRRARGWYSWAAVVAPHLGWSDKGGRDGALQWSGKHRHADGT